MHERQNQINVKVTGPVPMVLFALNTLHSCKIRSVFSEMLSAKYFRDAKNSVI